MKTNYTSKVLFMLSLLICLTINLSAQIRLVNVNPLNENVTIKNFGGSTVNISSYFLCVFPDYYQLSSLDILDGSLNLDSGEEVTVKSVANLVEAGGELGLYINNLGFLNADNMIDYVQWITSGNTRESVATRANIWTAGTTISNIITPPYQYNGDGITDFGQSFWNSTTLSTNNFSKNSFSIFPNPSKNNISISLKTPINSAIITIYDVTGKKVYNNNIIKDEKVNISHLLNGAYFIKISSEENSFVKQFIKL